MINQLMGAAVAERATATEELNNAGSHLSALTLHSSFRHNSSLTQLWLAVQVSPASPSASHILSSIISILSSENWSALVKGTCLDQEKHRRHKRVRGRRGPWKGSCMHFSSDDNMHFFFKKASCLLCVLDVVYSVRSGTTKKSPWNINLYPAGKHSSRVWNHKSLRLQNWMDRWPQSSISRSGPFHVCYTCTIQPQGSVCSIGRF